MSGHTPGPWSVYEDEEEPTLVVAHERAPSYWFPLWGRVFYKMSPTDRDRANARLIAAAPEMAAELREALAILQANQLEPKHQASIQAVLDKAGGR